MADAKDPIFTVDTTQNKGDFVSRIVINPPPTTLRRAEEALAASQSMARDEMIEHYRNQHERALKGERRLRKLFGKMVNGK